MHDYEHPTLKQVRDLRTKLDANELTGEDAVDALQALYNSFSPHISRIHPTAIDAMCGLAQILAEGRGLQDTSILAADISLMKDTEGYRENAVSVLTYERIRRGEPVDNHALAALRRGAEREILPSEKVAAIERVYGEQDIPEHLTMSEPIGCILFDDETIHGMQEKHGRETYRK